MQGESWNVLLYVHGMPLSVGNLNELDVYKNTLKKNAKLKRAVQSSQSLFRPQPASLHHQHQQDFMFVINVFRLNIV